MCILLLGETYCTQYLLIELWSLDLYASVTRSPDWPLLATSPPPQPTPQASQNWMVMVRNRVIYMTGGLNTGLTDWLFPENWILIKTADLTAIFSFISGLFGFTWYFPRKDHLNKILQHCHWYFVNKKELNPVRMYVPSYILLYLNLVSFIYLRMKTGNYLENLQKAD